MRLRQAVWDLTVCRLDGPGLPPWASGSAFLSYTESPGEASLVCESAHVPADLRADLRAEPGWRCLTVEGPLDFALIGIVARISAALAGAGVSVFVVSTHDTDHVLVKAERLEAAITALRAAGCEVD